jgi:hypothetical protein
MKIGWYFFIAVVLLVIAGAVISIFTTFAEEEAEIYNPSTGEGESYTDTEIASAKTPGNQNTKQIQELDYLPPRGGGGSSGGGSSGGDPDPDPYNPIPEEEICEIIVTDCEENSYNYDGDLEDLFLI